MTFYILGALNNEKDGTREKLIQRKKVIEILGKIDESVDKGKCDQMVRRWSGEYLTIYNNYILPNIIKICQNSLIILPTTLH